MSDLALAIPIFLSVIITFIICYQSLPKDSINELSHRKEYVISSFSNLAITLLSIIVAFYFTVYYDNDQDKEKLKGMLQSAIHSTEVTIITINEQMKSIEKNKSKLKANKYGDNINVNDFPLYEPIPYYDILPKVLDDGDLFSLLSDDSKYLLPEYTMNSAGIMEFYDTETNSYHNFLTLKHFKNNLEWQKIHLENELKYLNGTNIGFNNEKHSKKFYDALNAYLYENNDAYNNLSESDKRVFFENPFITGRICYGKKWTEIETEWREYTEILLN